MDKILVGPNFWSDKILVETNFWSDIILVGPNFWSDIILVNSQKFSHFCPTKFCPIRYDINTARKGMKKAGYDFALSTLDIVMKVLSPVILMLLNIMFYVSYPASMAISLLTAIPKRAT